MLKVLDVKCQSCRDAGHCVRTGECCHIRENVSVDPKKEAVLKQQVYLNSGVIYLYPFSKYTINLSHAEAQWMREEAKRRGTALNILPKKVLYDAKSNTAMVYDWFVDHDVCPFLEGTNVCSIYPDRPRICKDFPFNHLKQNQLEEIKTFITERRIDVVEEPYEKLVQKARDSLARQGVKC